MNVRIIYPDKKKNVPPIFLHYSKGVITCRNSAWDEISIRLAGLTFQPGLKRELGAGAVMVFSTKQIGGSGKTALKPGLKIALTSQQIFSPR